MIACEVFLCLAAACTRAVAFIFVIHRGLVFITAAYLVNQITYHGAVATAQGACNGNHDNTPRTGLPCGVKASYNGLP